MKLFSYLKIFFFSFFFTCCFGQEIIKCDNPGTEKPCFDIIGGVKRGCVPFTINIKECSGGCDNFFYLYEANKNDNKTSATTYTYNSPGVYTIKQIASCAGKGCTLEKIGFIEVLEAPKPNFELKLCEGRKVKLVINDSGYDEYIINWGDGNTQNVSSISGEIDHIYANTNQVTVNVRGNYLPANCGQSSAQDIKPINTLPIFPVTKIELQNISTTAGKIKVSFEADIAYNYKLQYKTVSASSFAEAKSFTNVSGMQIFEANNFDTENNVYCFRVQTISKCGEVSNSPAYCSVALNVLAENEQNAINWQVYPLTNFKSYQLYQNESVIFSSNDRNKISYIDSPTICNKEYCYHLVTQINNSQNTESISNKVCVKGKSKKEPSAPSILNSTVDSKGSVVLFWSGIDPTLVKTFQVKRNDSTWIVASPIEKIHDDKVKSYEEQFCYELSYNDACNNQSSISQATCPVFLRLVSSQSDKITLAWTAYKNAEDDFEKYILEKLDQNGEVIYSEEKGRNLQYDDFQAQNDDFVKRYRIKVIIDDNTGMISYSNILVVERKLKLFIPNAFTPNNDGLNDIFIPKMLFVNKFSMKIYNRSAQLLFESRDKQVGWDGKFNGNVLPPNTYIYIIEAEDFFGNKVQKKGTFVLLD